MTTRIRQERHKVDQFNLFLDIDAQEYEILDYSISGLSARSAKDVKLKEIVRGIIRIETIEVAAVTLNLVRTENHPNGIKLCFEGTPRIPVELIASSFELHKITAEQINHAAFLNGLPVELVANISMLRSALYALNAQINNVQRARNAPPFWDPKTYEHGIIDQTSRYLKKVFDDFLVRLQKDTKTMPKQLRNSVAAYVRGELEILYRAPAPQRFFDKPLGYAGDYEMMNIIYRNESEGQTLFDKAVHKFIIEHSNSKAVRNRKVYLASKIATAIKKAGAKTVRVLSLASGPAEELTEIPKLIPTLSTNLEITLMDQDVMSLQYAQMNAKTAMFDHGVNFKLKLINSGVRSLIKNEVQLEEYDLIYSAGLFDYLTDSVAERTASELYKHLRPGGTLIIGNFDLEESHKTLMDMILDWQLIYRTKDDLISLFKTVTPNILVESESEKMNLFAIMQK